MIECMSQRMQNNMNKSKARAQASQERNKHRDMYRHWGTICSKMDSDLLAEMGMDNTRQVQVTLGDATR